MVHTTAPAEVLTAIVVAKTGILLLGGLITYYTAKAYRRTGDPSLRALALGFSIITVGALLAGVLDAVAGFSLAVGVLVDAALTLVGFAVITYSLYAK